MTASSSPALEEPVAPVATVEEALAAEEPPRPLRIGLLGAGRQGQALAEAITRVPNCTIVAVCDAAEERSRALAERFDARYYTLWQSMLIFVDLDAVFIATPSSLHAEQALTALQERRHVYLEKPPALTLPLATRIAEAAAASERIVHVGLQHRYSDLVLPMYQALEGRAISTVHAHLYRGVPASREAWDDALTGGPLFEEGFHLLDLVRFLVDEVVAISAFQGRVFWHDQIDWASYDSVAVAFQLASGGTGTLSTTQAMPLPIPGHLALDVVAEGPLLVRFTGATLQVVDESGVQTWHIEQPPLFTAVARFLEAVRREDESALLVSYADALQTLRLALACRESAEGGRMVQLDV
ncbi:MAG: Gfo/Idh/MocA family oxidoreductase [Chloroflexi bacterium]|nr:Gfo/Idh/MocA family oxidoreductase [Chloroflexota bacterium]